MALYYLNVMKLSNIKKKKNVSYLQYEHYECHRNEYFSLK